MIDEREAPLCFILYLILSQDPVRRWFSQNAGVIYRTGCVCTNLSHLEVCTEIKSMQKLRSWNVTLHDLSLFSWSSEFLVLARSGRTLQQSGAIKESLALLKSVEARCTNWSPKKQHLLSQCHLYGWQSWEEKSYCSQVSISFHVFDS